MSSRSTDLRRLVQRNQRLVAGTVRGTLAAMAMTGLRQVTTGLGLVQQTPPEAVLKQSASGALGRRPRLASLVARRERAVIELAHWLYGAAGGAAFGLLPRRVVREAWSGPAYGLATWVLFELSVAPILGLDKAGQARVRERLAFAADHLLYGVILARGRGFATRRGPQLRRRR